MKFKEFFEKIKQFFKNLTPKQRMYIYIGLVLGFILINSMISDPVSNWMSALPKRIYQIFIPYGKFRLFDDFLINHIRKFAHFVEYLLFGILVSKYYFFKNKSAERFLNSMYLILTIAFIDETIQIVAGRNASVSDVWIDLSGGVMGVMVYLICKFYKYCKKVGKQDGEFERKIK